MKPVAAAKDYITENVEFPAHLVKDRLTSMDADSHDVSSVPNGGGCIVSLDGRKYAVHRDSHGTLHSFSPVCPHMGCDVGWNRAESSWDCPCHGSRFSATGEVLNGPAASPLSPLPVPRPTTPR